jgi:hypothetical protein
MTKRNREEVIATLNRVKRQKPSVPASFASQQRQERRLKAKYGPSSQQLRDYRVAASTKYFPTAFRSDVVSYKLDTMPLSKVRALAVAGQTPRKIDLLRHKDLKVVKSALARGFDADEITRFRLTQPSRAASNLKREAKRAAGIAQKRSILSNAPIVDLARIEAVDTRMNELRRMGFPDATNQELRGLEAFSEEPQHAASVIAYLKILRTLQRDFMQDRRGLSKVDAMRMAIKAYIDTAGVGMRVESIRGTNYEGGVFEAYLAYLDKKYDKR